MLKGLTGLVSLHTQAPKWRLISFLSQNCLPDSMGQGPSLRPSTLSLKPIAISRTYLSQRRKLSAQLCQPIAAGLPRPRRLGQWDGFPARTAARWGEAGPQASQGKAEFTALAGRRPGHLLDSLQVSGKGFGIVNKAEIDVFLELSCFFDDPVGNLISGSSAFSKTSWNIWKFTVHVLLKPGF